MYHLFSFKSDYEKSKKLYILKNDEKKNQKRIEKVFLFYSSNIPHLLGPGECCRANSN